MMLNLFSGQLYDYITKYTPSKGTLKGKKLKVSETELHSYLFEIIEGVTEMELVISFIIHYVTVNTRKQGITRINGLERGLMASGH